MEHDVYAAFQSALHPRQASSLAHEASWVVTLARGYLRLAQQCIGTARALPARICAVPTLRWWLSNYGCTLDTPSPIRGSMIATAA
ncbi:hypothetical protein HBI04_176120 [Parastagonospora nodorum]|nr:hypothetical protein HBI04_176120 [Parastagonospora nodorum]